MALLADGVSALFIDGKMSPGSAGTFPTINPATEEVLGVAADADADDMDRAIDAARRAFDDTDWSRNTELRVRCVRQLRDAICQGRGVCRGVGYPGIGGTPGVYERSRAMHDCRTGQNDSLG